MKLLNVKNDFGFKKNIEVDGETFGSVLAKILGIYFNFENFWWEIKCFRNIGARFQRNDK